MIKSIAYNYFHVEERFQRSNLCPHQYFRRVSLACPHTSCFATILPLAPVIQIVVLLPRLFVSSCLIGTHGSSCGSTYSSDYTVLSSAVRM